MFGKPEWFREKTTGWGIRPAKWQGWLYRAGWIGAMVVPFAALILRHQVPEALIWLTVISGLFAWDVRGILRSLRGTTAESEVLYIGDDGECVNQRMAVRGPVPTRK